MSSFTSPPAIAAACVFALAAGAAAGELTFAAPDFLPGDAAVGLAAGHQAEPDVALGDGQFLAVWSDFRTSPDDYPPFATEGSGADIYGARLDADGNVIGMPFVIDQDLGDQLEPRVAWNGTHWLVAWKRETVTLPTYERIEAVRVAADGTLLDAPPMVILDDQSYYNDHVVEGGPGAWVVLAQANGPTNGVLGVRVTGDGTVANPGGLLVHSTLFLVDFDLAFAADEYLVTWAGPFDPARGQRYAPDLTPIGAPIVLPWARRVASDGDDFLVAWDTGSPPAATVNTVLVTHDGLLPQPPETLFTSGNQDGTCCSDVTWDGTNYWVTWGGVFAARVSAAGAPLDPGGFTLPIAGSFSAPQLDGAPSGGAQLVWSDGANAAAAPKDVHTARLSPEGDLLASAPVSYGAPAQLDADFAAGDGMNLIVFRSRVSGSGRILAHRLDPNGAPLDAEPIEVASGPVSDLALPSLGAPAAAWNGSLFMITWSDGLSVFARRMLADGTFVDATPLAVMDGFDPDVSALGEVFLVVGIDYLLDNPQWQATHSMRVDGATGANLDAEPNALGGFVIFAQHPRVITWGARWLVTWQTNISHDNPTAGTKTAFVDADGTTPGVISVPLGWRPVAAVSESAALFVAVTNSIASATTDLAGVIMAPDGTFPAAPFTISAAPDKQLMPAAAWNGTQFVVAWEDKRSSVIYFDERTDIYGARVSVEGVVLDPGGVPLAASPLPEVDAQLLGGGGTTLLAVSSFRDDPSYGAFRIGIHAGGAATCAADVTGPVPGEPDGSVDALDFLLLIAQWGTPCMGTCEADITGPAAAPDGNVDALDFLMLLSQWGSPGHCPTP